MSLFSCSLAVSTKAISLFVSLAACL